MNKDLNVTLFIDNDASMDTHIEDLNKQLNVFLGAIKKMNCNVDVISFGGLTPNLFSAIQEKDNIQIQKQGLPLLATAIEFAHQNFVNKKAKESAKYKPWFIMLTNGRSYEAINEAVDKLRNDEELNAFFLPIALQKLSYAKIYSNIREVFKRPITLTKYNFNDLFKWLIMLIEERLSKPESEKMKLNREQLEGWAYL